MLRSLIAALLFSLGIFCLSQNDGSIHFKSAHAQSGGLDLGISKSVPSGGGGGPALDGTPTFVKSSLTVNFPVTSNSSDVCVLFENTSNGAVSSISDTTGHTAAWANYLLNNNGGNRVELWYTTTTAAISSGSTITVAGPSSTNGEQVACLSGGNVSSPWDGSGAQINGPDPFTNAITTSVANDFIIAGVNLSNNTTSTAGACCTLLLPTTDQNYLAVEYISNAAPGTYTINLGNDVGDAKGVVVGALKP